MSAAAANRVNASTLIAGYVIAAEKQGDHLFTTRRKTGVIHARVTGKTVVPSTQHRSPSRYVIHTDQGDTLPIPGIQTFPLIAAPGQSTDQAAPVVDDQAAPSVTAEPVDVAELWKAYELAREFAELGDTDPPTRTDMRPRSETFRGRRLRVARGRSWATIDMMVNGQLVGSTSGVSAAALDRAAVQLRRDVLAADERRVTDPDAYPAYWFKGATELPPAMVAYARHRAEQETRDRAALAATTCTDAGHVPGVLGHPADFKNCNGVPAGADQVRTEPIPDPAGTGFGEVGRELAARVADKIGADLVGPVTSGESDPYGRGLVRRFSVWQLPVSGHLVTVTHYEGRTPLTDTRSYIAVSVDGQLIDGAGDVNAGQPSAELMRFLAWHITEAVRKQDTDQGAAEVTDQGAAEVPAPAVTLAKGDTVTFVARGVTMTGAVVRVKRDGVTTVDVPGSEGTDSAWWDVNPQQILAASSTLADQGDQGDQGESDGYPVPTIDGVPTGMPYVVTMPEGWPAGGHRIEPKDVAKILRTEVLPAWFPGVKFSVRLDSGSMYVGADIRWTDGPSEEVVRLVANMWRGKFYDGQSETTSYRGWVVYVNAEGAPSAYDLPGISINTCRTVSDAAIEQAATFLRDVPEESVHRHSGYVDPFGRPWYGGSVQDCARWLATSGVDEWTRDMRGYGLRDNDACPVDRCQLVAGHPFNVHRDQYGRAFFATLPDQGDQGGNGGTPVDGGPDDQPTDGGGFRTWEELAEHIRPGSTVADAGRPAGTVEQATSWRLGPRDWSSPIHTIERPATVDVEPVDQGAAAVLPAAEQQHATVPAGQGDTGTSVSGDPEASAAPVQAADPVSAIVAGVPHRFTPKAEGDGSGPGFCVAPCHAYRNSPVHLVDPVGRTLVVINTGRCGINVHDRLCKDIPREVRAGGTAWDVTTPDLRGVVLDLYAGGDFEDFDPDRWADSAGDVTVMPCVGDLPDVADPVPAPAAPVVLPRPGDQVTVSGWSVSMFVVAVTDGRVIGDTGEIGRVPLDLVASVTTNTADVIVRDAQQMIADGRTPADVADDIRRLAELPAWTSGKPQPGMRVRVPALDDTQGVRLENVELLAQRVTELGCGCVRIECYRPGLVDPADNGHRAWVSVRTGCSWHDATASVPLPTPEELDAAEQLGRQCYADGLPASQFPTGADELAPTFKRLPVGTAVYSALITAYHRGYEGAAAVEVRHAEQAATTAEQDAAAAAVVAARNPQAQECADIAAHGATSAATNLVDRTARLEQAREATESASVAAGDQGDEPDGDGWPAFYTLPWEAYAPEVKSDDGDNVITITHTHEAGTVLTGSEKGDGVYEIAKRHGFGWGPQAGIHVKGSRDKFAQLTSLGKLADELRAAGHLVAVDVDDVWRPAAVRCEARAERVSARVERLTARAGRKFAEGNGRRSAAQQVGDGIPFGQPILVGHHSERRHRRAIERIEQGYRAAFAAYDYAEHLASRADGAAANEQAKQGPRAMMRRIDRVETESRRMQRELAKLLASDPGNRSPYWRRLSLEIERNAEEVAFIRAQLGDKAASGEFVAWSRADFQRGDHANVAGRWCEVTRVNAKTVTVKDRFGWGGAGTAPWDEIHGRRRDGMQWDSPNGTPWPVADAVKVAKWAELLSAARRAKPYDSDDLHARARVGLALRLILGLPRTALDAEVAAYGEPDGKAGKRARALAAYAAYERLTAGETFEEIAATVTPIGDTVPRWVMPAGEPVDVLPANLVPGDVVVGVWDNFAGMRTLARFAVGPVTAPVNPYDRREGGDWVTVQVDGEDHEVRSHRWFSAHLTGAR